MQQDFKSFMQSLWACCSKEQLQRTFKIDIQTKVVTTYDQQNQTALSSLFTQFFLLLKISCEVKKFSWQHAALLGDFLKPWQKLCLFIYLCTLYLMLLRAVYSQVKIPTITVLSLGLYTHYIQSLSKRLSILYTVYINTDHVISKTWLNLIVLYYFLLISIVRITVRT